MVKASFLSYRNIFTIRRGRGQGQFRPIPQGKALSCHQGRGHSGHSPLRAAASLAPPPFWFSCALAFAFVLPPSSSPSLCSAKLPETRGRSRAAPNALISARRVLLPPLLYGARPPAQHRAGGDGQVRARGCCRFFVTFKLPLPPLFSSLENLLGR